MIVNNPESRSIPEKPILPRWHQPISIDTASTIERISAAQGIRYLITMTPNLAEDSAVLLNIIVFLDIPTILSFRRTCKSIHGLISRYEYSIAQTAKACAWHQKMDDEVTYLSVSSLSDLSRLNIARQLAIELVASRQLLCFFDNYYCVGIALDNPLGDEMRDYVTRGLMLVYKIHRLYTDIEGTNLGTKDKLLDTIRSILKGEPTQSQKAEVKKLQKAWSQYCDSLTSKDFIALGLVNRMMIGTFMYDGRLTESCGGSPLWIHVKARGEYSAVEWLVGFILLQGPIFIKKFRSQEQTMRKSACLSIEVGCKKRTAKVIALEHTTICSLSVPQTRDMLEETRAYYISVYKFRRGPLPAEMSWEEQMRIRQRDCWQWSMSCTGYFLAGVIPKGQWVKARYRNRVKPVAYFDQESQDLQ